MMLKLATLLVLVALTAQAQAPRIEALVAAVRPALPYPAASSDGELPANETASARWFVVWPDGPDETSIVVKANPLHRETQKAGVEAMEQINAAVVAAERRAQEAYDKAMEQLRRTGKGSELEVITLDDEGIAGERIDAELEVVIALEPVESFVMESSEAPVVTDGRDGVAFVVTVGPNTYRPVRGAHGSPKRDESFDSLIFRLPKPIKPYPLHDALRRATQAAGAGAQAGATDLVGTAVRPS
jgi:hypothetical protein